MAVFAILLCLVGGAIGVTSDSCPSNIQKCFLEEYNSISEQCRKEIEELVARKIEQFLGSHTPLAQTFASAIAPTESSLDEVTSEAAKSQNVTEGVSDISPPGLGTKEVNCDAMTDGEKWIVFQRRMDGSVDFFRNWNEYVAGFGMPSGEHWLGLEKIHQLTKHGNTELLIDMITHDGTQYYASYSNFHIGPASDNYRLHVSGYCGNATDSLENPPGNYADLNGKQFSTKDHGARPDCARTYQGAWWYRACTVSNLNGNYNLRDWFGVVWRYQTNGTDMNMRFTEMKLRRKVKA